MAELEFKRKKTMKSIKTTLLILFSLVMSIASGQSEKHLTLLWDASFSMFEKEIEKEFELLENLFATNDYNQVTLVVFANKTQQEKNFNQNTNTSTTSSPTNKQHHATTSTTSKVSVDL